MELKIIFHGVPNGQKKWGDLDERSEPYVGSLYNSNDWDAKEFLKVEGANGYVYYTFVKCGNVFAKNGRNGSYVGITLRMDCFYSDIQNIYFILNAAYEKFLVGNCVVDDGQQIKYLISEFDEKKDVLGECKKQLSDYITHFSVSDDLNNVSVVGRSSNISKFNLAFCDKKSAKQAIVKGGLKVSVFYPSPEVQLISKKYNAEIQKIKQSKEQDLQAQKNSYESKLKKSKENYDKQLSETNNQLKSANKSVIEKDRKIEELNKNIKDLELKQNNADKEISKLKNEIDGFKNDDKQKKYKRLEHEKQKLEDKNKNLIREIEDLKQTNDGHPGKEKEYTGNPIIKIIKFILRYILSVVNFIVLIIVLFWINSLSSTIKDVKNEVSLSREELIELQTSKNEDTNKDVSQSTEPQKSQLNNTDKEKKAQSNVKNKKDNQTSSSDTTKKKN